MSIQNRQDLLRVSVMALLIVPNPKNGRAQQKSQGGGSGEEENLFCPDLVQKMVRVEKITDVLISWKVSILLNVILFVKQFLLESHSK